MPNSSSSSQHLHISFFSVSLLLAQNHPRRTSSEGTTHSNYVDLYITARLILFLESERSKCCGLAILSSQAYGSWYSLKILYLQNTGSESNQNQGCIYVTLSQTTSTPLSPPQSP